MNELDRPYHPAAMLFPLITGDEFEALKTDIRENGLLEAIWLHPDGSILDGRNRHRACIETGIAPRFRTWDGLGSAVVFVVSMNLHRRHLTASQRATVAVEMLPALEAEARQRQIDLAGSRPNTQTDLVEIIPLGIGKSRDIAATATNANPHYVTDAKALQADAPDLFEQVRDGSKTIPQAKRELVKRQRAETPPMPSDLYRVLYADPPWKYNDAGIIGETDHYGHVARHYPSMSIAELCELGTAIKECTESDSVLFIWVTSPMLEDAFSVIKAWGFAYKTSFVWDKVGHNYGHYNSVRHELLLVCTKGQCTPDVPTLIDSVQTIEKTRVHSEKPEEFRAIIDTLYTHGKKLELFSRRDADGWDSWGNEPR